MLRKSEEKPLFLLNSRLIPFAEKVSSRGSLSKRAAVRLLGLSSVPPTKDLRTYAKEEKINNHDKRADQRNRSPVGSGTLPG